MWRIAKGGHEGVLHCVGRESVDRVTLARRTAEAFGLDPRLVDVGPPDPAAVAGMRVPYDTTLDAARTAERLGVELPSLDEMLARLPAELDASGVAQAARSEQEAAA
jgi:dTDP-4-dehydrorhamnose reductase